ncbi:MAG: low molecular weight protein-tyrosine-phosphatase [Pseudomonadota bacterium]
MYSVLFVCTGNICRSPTAEAVFRHHIEQHDLSDKVTTDSAGTHGYHVGDPPNESAVLVAKERGISMDGLAARKFDASDFDRFDLVLAMDDGHFRILDAHRPSDGKGDLKMFMDFAPGQGVRDVPDPYYGGIEDFEYALNLIEAGSLGLITHIRDRIL